MARLEKINVTMRIFWSVGALASITDVTSDGNILPKIFSQTFSRHDAKLCIKPWENRVFLDRDSILGFSEHAHFISSWPMRCGAGITSNAFLYSDWLRPMTPRRTELVITFYGMRSVSICSRSTVVKCQPFWIIIRVRFPPRRHQFSLAIISRRHRPENGRTRQGFRNKGEQSF